jgi:hypothetical protein
MRFREHRGSREESLQTEVELAGLDALLEHLRRLQETGQLPRGDDWLKPMIVPYAIDAGAEQWTWIVRSPMGVIGFLRD